MEDFDYNHSRTELHFGRGRREDVGDVTAAYGDEAHLVTTRSAMQESGVLDDVVESLEEADVSSSVFDDVDPNPTLKTVVGCVEASDDPEVVVALGGGSVLDTAKTAALSIAAFGGTPTKEQVWDYASGYLSVDVAAPVVAVPSTSGTGSHVDPWAVVTNQEERAKVGFGGRPLVPVEAIVDPEIADHMPPELAARTGFDAFCHLNEAFVSTRNDPVTDALALRGVEEAGNHLSDSVEGDSHARDEMTVVDTLGGFCETTAGVIATHALAHGVGAFHPDVAHGDALAAVAAEVVDYNVENGDDETKRRYGMLAERLGAPVADRKLDAPLAGDAFRELMEDVGVATSLSELGVKEAEIESIAANAAVYMGPAIRANPTEIEKDDLVSVLEKAY